MSLATTRSTKTVFALSLVVFSQVVSIASAGCGGGIGGGGFHRPPARAYGQSRSYTPAYRPVARPQYQPAPQYHSAPQPAIRVVQTRPVSQPVRQPVQQQLIQQPVAQQPVQQPQQVAQQPVQQQSAATTPAPVSQQPTQTAQQNATQSALAFLANEPAQQQTQPQESTASHVGSWKATTAGGATVTLNLNDDGQFSWVAQNNGKTSQFGGRFTIENGTLTLARSSDNQKLAGKMTFSGSGFNFLLNGAKDGGLNFQQS